MEQELQLPQFTHSEVAQLYKLSFEEAPKVLGKIMQLPQASLIQDLEKVLIDGLDRYAYFIEADVNESSFDWDTINAPVFALLILAELEAKESLPAVLTFFGAGKEELYEFYFGDMLGQHVWQIFYKVNNSNLAQYNELLFNSSIYEYVRTELSVAAYQVALHQPERRKEVMAWYKEVLNHFITSPESDNKTLIGLIVTDIMDIQGEELLPSIKKLFELDRVDLTVCGAFDLVEEEIKVPSDRVKRKLVSLAAQCKEIASWSGEEDDFDVSDFLGSSRTQSLLSEPKIGRNELCPCGSGKKYKKCCGE